ncbi:hypothetical protein TI04_03205 [Achromatium sp. WMS2]|nr:hypothetical protein TI04_03205 [Achromatium sp. WMS2]
MDDGSVFYAYRDQVWFIKLVGAACHPLGPTLNNLVDKALSTPESKNFVVDISATTSIDSTCLGILSRIATRPKPANTPKPVIITGGGDIDRAVRVVRFDLLFDVVKSTDTPIVTGTKAIPALVADQTEKLKLLLDAHKNLCAIDATTHAEFKDVVKILESEFLIHTRL